MVTFDISSTLTTDEIMWIWFDELYVRNNMMILYMNVWVSTLLEIWNTFSLWYDLPCFDEWNRIPWGVCYQVVDKDIALFVFQSIWGVHLTATSNGTERQTITFTTPFTSIDPILITWRILLINYFVCTLWIVNSELSGWWIKIKAWITEGYSVFSFWNHDWYIRNCEKGVIYELVIYAIVLHVSFVSVTRIVVSIR